MTELRCLTPVFDGACIELSYVAGERRFTEIVELPAPIEVDETVVDLAWLLSMVTSLSYYKALVPASLATEFETSPEEQAFYESVVANGLAEFAYRNDLPEALTPEFDLVSRRASRSSTSDGGVSVVEVRAERASKPRDAVLVPVGGGKDSIVTIEALRAIGREVVLFSVNDYAPIAATVERAGLPRLIARRTLDPQLFELNAAGAPNGHVPVTAINSVIALLVAHQAGIDEVVFSNEASSSFGNLEWHGRVVNHQWSKGIEFERMLHDLAAPYAMRYVSLLRPLSELAIMRRFAHHVQYHDVFTSCNRAFQLDPSKRRIWCGECDKCRFVFLSLAPFVGRARIEAIFGKDLLGDPSQQEGFLELLNVGDRLKPFECVGEPSECRVALDLIRESPDWQGHPFLAAPEIVSLASTQTDRDFAFAWRDEHLLDGDLEKAARAVL